MEIIKNKTETIIKNISDFNLKKIFECGQCFRWEENANGSYSGVAMGRALRISEREGSVHLGCTPHEFDTVWHSYFDMDRDYEAARTAVSINEYMKTVAENGKGIRILKQDKWEALASFILSQCNNLKRIKGIVSRLCDNFGEPIDFEGGRVYSFPAAEKVASLELRDLDVLRCGYRAPYLLNAARIIADGELDIESIAEGTYSDAAAALRTLPGVGEKVADCVILFGFHMLNAFPIDVWMKRAILKNFGKGFDSSIFGENAGIAQQYIFYYARETENFTKA